MALKYQVGLRIRDLRRAASLTQDELAERTGKSSQAISQIERGQIGASIETIEAISNAIGAPPASLFPATVGGRKPTARDETLSAISGYASQLTADDSKTLEIISEALLGRRRKS